MVSAIEHKARESIDGREVAQLHLSTVKESHLQEIQEIEQRHFLTKSHLEESLDKLSEKNAELELRHKLLSAQSLSEVDSLKAQIETLDASRLKALEQGKSIEIQKLRMLEEAETRHKATIE